MTDAEHGRHNDLIEPDQDFLIGHLKNRVYGVYPFAAELFTTLENTYPAAAIHSQRTSLIAATAAGLLSLPETEIDRIAVSGMLHDIGKLDIPPGNRTGPLAKEDLEFVRTIHMQRGREILRGIGCPPDIMYIAMSHHDAFPSNDTYRSGMVYPRRGTNGYEGPDRRLPQTPDTIRAARLIWLADKADRDVNGYEGSRRKAYSRFAGEFYTNYDPAAFGQEPALFASVKQAVLHIFYHPTQTAYIM